MQTWWANDNWGAWVSFPTSYVYCRTCCDYNSYFLQLHWHAGLRCGLHGTFHRKHPKFWKKCWTLTGNKASIGTAELKMQNKSNLFQCTQFVGIETELRKQWLIGPNTRAAISDRCASVSCYDVVIFKFPPKTCCSLSNMLDWGPISQYILERTPLAHEMYTLAIAINT